MRRTAAGGGRRACAWACVQVRAWWGGRGPGDARGLLFSATSCSRRTAPRPRTRCGPTRGARSRACRPRAPPSPGTTGCRPPARARRRRSPAAPRSPARPRAPARAWAASGGTRGRAAPCPPSCRPGCAGRRPAGRSRPSSGTGPVAADARGDAARWGDGRGGGAARRRRLDVRCRGTGASAGRPGWRRPAAPSCPAGGQRCRLGSLGWSAGL